MKYRKKPVVVEATQWFKDGDHPAVRPSRFAQVTKRVGVIDTLEGEMVVTPGDWIITGVKGEHYPVKDEIFRETYEAAE